MIGKFIEKMNLFGLSFIAIILILIVIFVVNTLFISLIVFGVWWALAFLGVIAAPVFKYCVLIAFIIVLLSN